MNLFKDRGPISSKKRGEDWVNLFPAGKTRTASSESNTSLPGSATTQTPNQDTANCSNPEQQPATAQTMNQALQMPSDMNTVNINGQSNIDVAQPEN